MTHFNHYRPFDEYDVWISGVYKIVSYQPGEFYAYFIQEGSTNWGDRVGKPPATNGRYNFWPSFESAVADCEEHAKHYTPSSKTVKRAADIEQAFAGEETA